MPAADSSHAPYICMGHQFEWHPCSQYHFFLCLGTYGAESIHIKTRGENSIVSSLTHVTVITSTTSSLTSRVRHSAPVQASAGNLYLLHLLLLRLPAHK